MTHRDIDVNPGSRVHQRTASANDRINLC